MEDSAARARDLLAARREHSKGQGNFPTPEPHFGMRDERPEDREPRDLPKERDDRSAPKGDVPVGQEDRNPGFETRVPRTAAPSADPAGSMEHAKREVGRPGAGGDGGRSRREIPRPNARRSSAARREATRRERPRRQGRPEPGRAAKDTEKNAKRRAGEARAAKRTAAVPRRTTSPVRRAAGLTAAPRRTAKTAPPEQRSAGGRRGSGAGRSGNVQRTAARTRGSAKPLTKRAAKSAGPNATRATAQGGKKASRRTSAGKGRSGRR